MTKDEILKKKVGFISLGCDKNRVDLEKIIFNIKSAGFEIVNDPSTANIIIINTCSFLESSRLESIENILEMSNYKTDKLEKLIPDGTVINKIELKKDILYIDFSKEFIEKHQGGEEMESNTIYSIVNTMTQLTEVNGIKILIDGKENEAFKDGKIKFDNIFVKLDK